MWLAVLTLAQMRSPFLPSGYGSFVVLWLIAHHFAVTRIEDASRLRSVWFLMLGLLFSLNYPLPIGGQDFSSDLWVALASSLLAILLAVRCLLAGPKCSPALQDRQAGSVGY